MRSTVLIGFALLTFACGDDSGGVGGAGGDAAVSTAASSGDGGAGPTTTGAGGILDDGTEEAIEACNAASAATEAVSTELGCAVEVDDETCDANAASWVPCVVEWSAYYACAEAATTADACSCAGDEPAITCDLETSCTDELDALDACGA